MDGKKVLANSGGYDIVMYSHEAFNPVRELFTGGSPVVWVIQRGLKVTPETAAGFALRMWCQEKPDDDGEFYADQIWNGFLTPDNRDNRVQFWANGVDGKSTLEESITIFKDVESAFSAASRHAGGFTRNGVRPWFVVYRIELDAGKREARFIAHKWTSNHPAAVRSKEQQPSQQVLV